MAPLTALNTYGSFVDRGAASAALITLTMARGDFTVRGSVTFQLNARAYLEPLFSHAQLMRLKPGFRANIRLLLNSQTPC